MVAEVRILRASFVRFPTLKTGMTFGLATSARVRSFVGTGVGVGEEVREMDQGQAGSDQYVGCGTHESNAFFPTWR